MPIREEEQIKGNHFGKEGQKQSLLEQKTLQFAWKHKRSKIAKAILQKKNRAGGVS